MAEILELSGDITPDATGDFLVIGTHNGAPCRYNATKGFFHWYYPEGPNWYFSKILGETEDGDWVAEDIIDDYYPDVPYLGIGHTQLKTSEHYHIYRGQDENIDYESIQGEMSLDTASVILLNQALPPGTIWDYIRRQINACGKESSDSPLCEVVIDAGGDMVPLCPNPPMDIFVTPVAGGKFKLKWRYNAAEQKIQPSGFKIYSVNDGEWTLLDTLTYSIGAWGEFEWTSGAFENGQQCHFCVRSYATGYGESQNTNLVSGTADTIGPPVITGLEATLVEI